MIKIQWRKWLFVLCILLPIVSFADVPAWKIVPNESSLSFTATQNGAPVSGKFTKFSGDIHFDPNQLDKSHVKIIVDIGSISDAYNQLSDTLKTPEWFNTKVFPQAIFESKELTKTGDKTYQAKGNLTIRDKTQPVTLTFTQEEYTATKARMKGETTIKRTAFGVGQGEWADTKAVKDDVHIDFTVVAVK
ncbi:MAG: YceI family protein [Gammaproteobacteria bacterium]